MRKREGVRVGDRERKRDTCSYSQDGSSHTIGCRLVRCDCSPALPAVAERYSKYLHIT